MVLFGGVCCFSSRFCYFSFFLVILRNFVNLQAEKGKVTICPPDYLNVINHNYYVMR